MERADLLDVERCRFFQESLHLCAVFADDTDVVTSRFVSPRLVSVERAKLAESVGGKEHLILAVVGHDDLGPVNHGSRYKVQCMRAEGKRVTFADDHALIRKVSAEEIFHHCKRLRGSDHGDARICLDEIHDVRGVVGLHVLDHEIIGAFRAEHVLNVIEPFVREACVYRVHNGDLFVHDDVRIVAHTVRYLVLSFKKVYLSVVNADVKNIVRNFHNLHPPKILY